jgi:hypothetical protein
VCTSMSNVARIKATAFPIAYRQVIAAAERRSDGERFDQGDDDGHIADNDPDGQKPVGEVRPHHVRGPPIGDIGRQGSYKAGSRRKQRAVGRMAACRSERLNGDPREPSRRPFADLNPTLSKRSAEQCVPSSSRHSQSPPNTNKRFSKRWGTVERDDVVNSAIGTLDFRVQVQ